jgi:serine/threonine-protein kinase
VGGGERLRRISARSGTVQPAARALRRLLHGGCSDILPAVKDARIGTTLEGRYQIVDRLAAGGMGVVYRGERLGLGRGVAIKFLHAHMAADSSFLKRFAIEAKAMALLQHANCAAVIDFGVDGEEPYVVMDLVGGESLRRVLDRGRLPAGRALGIMRQILSGLAHAHSHGITHRDIKPDNIMVDASGAFGDQVRILDFGLAKLREGASALTTGFVVGTPSYMAPEQTLAQPVDERTDIYACGVVLFEMLTGKKPFHAEEAVEVLIMHRETPPPRLAGLAPDLRFSDELEAAVLQAMAKDPAHRFSSAAAFATALEHVPEGATRPSAAMAAAVPAPALAGAPRAPIVGTEATAWASPQAVAAPVSQGNATEYLGSSQIQIASSQATPARPATAEPAGSAQLRAFTAELAASQPAQPLAAVTAQQGTSQHLQVPGPAPTVAGRVITPRPDTPVPLAGSASPGQHASSEFPVARAGSEFPVARAGSEFPVARAGSEFPVARAGSEFPGTRAGSEFPVARAGSEFPVARAGSEFPVARAGSEFPAHPGDSVQSAVGQESGSLAPWTGASAAAQTQARPAGKRKRWAIGAAAAGALVLLVVAGVVGSRTPAERAGERPAAGEPAEPAAQDEPAEDSGYAFEIQEPDYQDPKLASDFVYAKAYLKQGQYRRARDLLERLRRYDPGNATIHYLLGKAYMGELWVKDGLDAFRDAIALEPGFRIHAELIESAAVGLGSDSQHAAVARFLLREIGPAARPALENIAAGHHREDVRERAQRALSQFP